MEANPTVAAASESQAWPTGWPWKLPHEMISSSSLRTMGLSQTPANSRSRVATVFESTSRKAPWTCGAQRIE